MPLDQDVKSAMDPKNFPRWAEACPKSFGEMKLALARAGVELAKTPISDSHRARIGQILAHVAATCFTAGMNAQKEMGGGSILT